MDRVVKRMPISSTTEVRCFDAETMRWGKDINEHTPAEDITKAWHNILVPCMVFYSSRWVILDEINFMILVQINTFSLVI